MKRRWVQWGQGPELCLQGSLALSQGGFDGGHQLPKLALCVHEAIASLLGVNQLPGYRHFKEAGGLGRPLTTDGQASGELIFQPLLELEELGLVASSATGRPGHQSESRRENRGGEKAARGGDVPSGERAAQTHTVRGKRAGTDTETRPKQGRQETPEGGRERW